MFLSELNGLTMAALDIGNAYLEAYTQERVCIIAGPEFAPFGLERHLLLIDKALYGPKTSGARFRESLADFLRDLGWVPSYADNDVWMKDCGDYWAYICTYVDDLIVMHKDPMSIVKILENRYTLKGVGTPEYHLDGDIEW